MYPNFFTCHNELAFDVKILNNATRGIGARDVAEIHHPNMIAQEG